MDKPSIELNTRLKNEDFKYVYNVLQNVQLSQTESLNLILTACQVYRDSTSNNSISCEDLLKLVKCLTGQIAAFNFKQCEKYLHAVFCFLKGLSRQNHYGAIIEFKPFIFPSFCKAELRGSLTKYYYNIMTSIYNDLGKIFNSRLTHHKNEMLPLAEIITEIAEVTQSKDIHAEYVNRCILALLAMEIPFEQIEPIYLKNMKAFEKINEKEVAAKLLAGTIPFFKYRKFTGTETCFQAVCDAIAPNFPEIASILDIRHWFSSNATDSITELKSVLLALRHYVKTNGCTPTLELLFKLIRYFALNNETIFNKSPAQQMALLRFFWHMSSDFKSWKCASCACKSSNCSAEAEKLDSLEFLSLIGRIGMKFFSKAQQIQRVYKLELLKFLDGYNESCNILKSKNCGYFSKVHTECTYYFYQIGLFLYKNSDPEMSIVFMQRYVKAVILHEGASHDHQYLSGAFKTIAENFCELKQYEKSLATSALACFLKFDATQHVVAWIKTKVACRDNTTLQKSTFVSILESCNNELTTSYFTSEFALTKDDRIRLLVLELDSYKKRWKSKIPMMAVFKQLIALEDSLACAKLAVRTWEFGNIPAQESFSSVLKDLAMKIPENTASTSLLLAHLNFLIHKLQLVDAVVENCSHIEKTMLNMTKAQQDQVQELVPGDAADETEIVSAYSSLKLNKYVKMMKHLDCSFDLLQTTLEGPFEGDEHVDLETLYDLLIHVGHEYFLHNHIIKSVAMLELALEFAIKLDRKEYVLQSSGYVLEQANAGNTSKIGEIVEKAEESITYLEQNGFFKELFVYFLCKSDCFVHTNPDLAFKSFTQAVKYKEKFPSDIMHLARMNYVKHRLLMLPCKFNAEEHRKRTNSLIHFAQAHAFRHYNETQSESTVERTYNMALVFKIQEDMTKMYSDLHLPRHTLAYTKEVLVIAQKMILPFRVSKLLYYLSQADIFFGNLSACEEKLSGLTTILGIVQKTPSPKPAKKRDLEVEGALDCLVFGMKEMVMEVPKNPPFFQAQASSPTFRVETFRLPSFLGHKLTCQCFTCNWLEYQLAILHKTLIQGMVQVYSRNLYEAQQFFSGGLRIINALETRNSKILLEQNLDDLVSTRLFDECNYLLLKEWGDVVLRCGGKGIEYAEELNTKVWTLFKKSEQLDLMHVYDKILVQKMNICRLKVVAKKKKLPKTMLAVETLSSGPSTASTTPESKQSKVTVSTIAAPKSLSPVPPPANRYIKPIKFNIFDDEEEEVAPAPKKKPVNKHLHNAIATNLKTPTPKAKVYTLKATATRIKKVLSEVATPQVKEDEDMFDFLLPASDQTSYLTIEKQSEKKLTDRTKILTEKLKSSMKKPAPTENLPSSSRKKSVRTNLLSDLEQADSENVQKLRRSRRNI